VTSEGRERVQLRLAFHLPDCFALVCTQTTLGYTAFLRSMIPHYDPGSHTHAASASRRCASNGAESYSICQKVSAVAARRIAFEPREHANVY